MKLTRTKKIVLAVVALLFVGLAGVAVYVTNIDWNQHKDKIARQFYNSTGKTISFDGKLSFEILPTPYLNAADAKIYNDEAKAGKPLLEIKNVVAELALIPLIKGEVHVKKMTLDGVVINIDWSDEGLSWQNDLSPDQRQMMENTNMILNSVSLKNALLNFEDSSSGIGFKLTDLNGEIFAQSIFGPFRIEGNYLKGNSPEGFALSIGKLSENLATTLNLVVTHPLSDSYVRFDGSFHLVNKVLNGNVVMESQKLSDFVNANFEEIKLSQNYNKPAAFGFDIALNKQKLGMSNIVVKYGDTQGSGVLEMPWTKAGKTEIKTSFNFSDLDLTPAIDFAKDMIEKYRTEPFDPQYPVDLDAEIKSVRSSYQGQGLKNLAADFSIKKDQITLNDLSVVLPGNTEFKLKGIVYPYEEELYYQTDLSFSSNDFIQTLEWLKLSPKVNASSVYKKILATLKMSGNLEKIQISPYKITMDKSTVSGEAGIILGGRKDIMLVMEADTINFDNYISALPEEEKSKSWGERMAYRFKKLGILNDVDLVLDAKAGLIIYESMPFEKVDVKGNVLNGVMEIDYAKTEKMANTALEIKGNLSGFGDTPKLDNLQYDIKSNDVVSLINKLELKVPDLDYKRFNNLNMSGTINGDMDKFGINTLFELGNLNAAYQGLVANEAGKINYDGNLEIRHPEFSTLLENIKASYRPEARSLGVFKLNADVLGNKDDLRLSNLVFNVGYMTAEGEIHYDSAAERPIIMGQLSINKLDLDKVLPSSKTSLINIQTQDKEVDFWAKPFWSKDKIDYSPYIYADVKGEFEVKELLYNAYQVNDAKFKLEALSGTLNVSEFSGLYKNAPIEGRISLYMNEAPTINGSLGIKEASVNDFAIGGKVYNLKGGKFSAKLDFSSKADSFQSFADNFKGKGEFSAVGTEVGGIDLKAVYDDLIKRETSSGLSELVKSKVSSGKTLFDKVAGRAILENGGYSLADASMQNSDVNVTIYGDGSLPDWDMNVVFNVKYAEPKYLPEFSFSLKNSMESPMADVNVSSLFNMYEAQEKLKQEALEAEIAAEKARLDGLVQEQRKIADALVASTREGLEKDVDARMNIVTANENVNKYNLLKQEIAQSLAELVETMDSAAGVEINDELIQKLENANQSISKRLVDIARTSDEIYLADLQKQNEFLFNRAVETYNKLKQTVFNVSAGIDKYRERLSRITTSYDLETDEEFRRLKESVDVQASKIVDLGDEVISERLFINPGIGVEEYEKNNRELDEFLQKTDEIKKILDEDSAAIYSYVGSIVEAEEKKYKEEKERQEEQKLIEENTGTISIKKTGQTVTIKRDIEDIKNAENEINQNAVKVLDFSKEKATEESVEEMPSENVIKKGRNIRIN